LAYSSELKGNVKELGAMDDERKRKGRAHDVKM
jgi:hypothetical protein